MTQFKKQRAQRALHKSRAVQKQQVEAHKNASERHIKKKPEVQHVVRTLNPQQHSWDLASKAHRRSVLLKLNSEAAREREGERGNSSESLTRASYLSRCSFLLGDSGKCGGLLYSCGYIWDTAAAFFCPDISGCAAALSTSR